jgi:hypothetical protein
MSNSLIIPAIRCNTRDVIYSLWLTPDWMRIMRLDKLDELVANDGHEDELEGNSISSFMLNV